jgi:hypothetical protein
VRTTWTIVSAAAALSAAACAGNQQGEAAADSAAAAQTATADTGAAGATSAAGTMAGDPDQATGGSGVPAGFTGRTDNPSAALSAAKYTATGGQWEVTTGPAHIVYRPADTGTGQYTASATFEQLEAPRHPEAYGLFIGGQNLDQPTQRYTYFIVRGTGEYAVKVRDGSETRDVVAFRAGVGMAKADTSGRATYRLAAQVTADSVRFLVNDRPVTSVAKSAVPAEGIAGLRINHNLHVRTGPISISR